MNDVVIGAWRNGLTPTLASDVKVIEERREKGFRLLPYESTVSDLTLVLDGYDAFANETLTEDCRHTEPPTETMPLPFAGEMDEGAAELLTGFAPTNNYTAERRAKTKK